MEDAKLIVINKLSLGKRELGWELYSLPKGEILEFTSKQVKDLINEGVIGVYGLEISKETGELVFDKSFYVTNMMNKTHINTLTPLNKESSLNKVYTVIGTHKTKKGLMYDVISSRYERRSFDEAELKALLKTGMVSGGATIIEDEIVLARFDKPVIDLDETLLTTPLNQ